MPYLGASPPAVFSAPTKDRFSGDGSTTVFTLGKSAGGAAALDVFVANVRQEPFVAYTVSDKTLTFTSAPASGTNNVYVINNSTVIGNGLIPVPGRDSDRVTNMTVDGTSTLTGNVTAGGNISATSGNIVAGGTLSGVTTLTTSSTATIGGDTAISGNLRSDSSADGIQIDATDGSASNAGDLVLLDGTDGSATNAGSSLLYEDGTGDPSKLFTDNTVFSGSVKIGGAIIEEDSSQLKINGQVVSFGKAALGSTFIAASDTFAGKTDNVLLDFNSHNNFILTLDGSITLTNPTTENVGQSGVIIAIQDGTGSRTITLGGDYESVGGSGITLSSAANAVDVMPYVVIAANRIAVGTPQLAFG